MDAHARPSRVNLTEDGIARLRQGVKEKLKEFMGDYTDDTLVEYVIVLLKNGRQKEEARKELDVFLGDDTDSFVSWLWDHLTANSHLCMQPKESSADGGPKDIGKHVRQLGSASGDPDSIFDHEKETYVKSRTRHNREWKGLAHEESEPLILRSTLDDDDRSGDRHHSPIRKSSSPRPQIQRMRSRQDEEFSTKKEVAPRPKLDAPRRLLQFAVRDAVRTVQKTSLKSEPSLKRLRSVVSSSVVDVPSDEQPKRTRSVAIVAGGAAALKAAAEAAEDVVKGRGPGNVFDRLGHGSGRSYTYARNQTTNFERFAVTEGDEDFVRSSKESKHGGYLQRNEQSQSVGDMTDTTMMDRIAAAAVASDSGSENDDADNVDTLTRATERLRSAEICSSQMDKDIALTQQSAAQTTNEIMNTTMRNDPIPPPLSGPNSAQKTLNISINVNTWKPPHYQVPDQNKEAGNQVAVEGNGESSLKLNTRVIKDNDVGSTPKKDVPVCQGDSNDIQKPSSSLHGAYPSVRPADDADSRTVFISNVHFAATKDTLSRHFNKFGEVLKVIIVTDATTGQPKGSAYVEFLRKESAELALSLNGTSFMSRILKVVTRNAAHHEAAALMSWPRIARSSAFPSRFSRMAFSRGLMPSNLRARLPLKPGPRSLQWKRDSPGVPGNEEIKPASTASTPRGAAISPSGRNLTYVRPELKTDGNMGIA